MKEMTQINKFWLNSFGKFTAETSKINQELAAALGATKGDKTGFEFNGRTYGVCALSKKCAEKGFGFFSIGQHPNDRREFHIGQTVNVAELLAFINS